MRDNLRIEVFAVFFGGLFLRLQSDVFFETEMMIHDFVGDFGVADVSYLIGLARDAGDGLLAGRIAVDESIICESLVEFAESGDGFLTFCGLSVPLGCGTIFPIPNENIDEKSSVMLGIARESGGIGLRPTWEITVIIVDFLLVFCRAIGAEKLYGETFSFHGGLKLTEGFCGGTLNGGGFAVGVGEIDDIALYGLVVVAAKFIGVLRVDNHEIVNFGAFGGTAWDIVCMGDRGRKEKRGKNEYYCQEKSETTGKFRAGG